MNNMESSISFLFSCLGYSRTELISWYRALFEMPIEVQRDALWITWGRASLSQSTLRRWMVGEWCIIKNFEWSGRGLFDVISGHFTGRDWRISRTSVPAKGQTVQWEALLDEQLAGFGCTIKCISGSKMSSFYYINFFIVKIRLQVRNPYF